MGRGVANFFKRIRSWSLPTKLSLIMGLLAIALWGWDKVFDDSATKADVREMLKKKTLEIEVEQRFKLRYKYPLGYSMFYSNRFDPVVYPARLETQVHGVQIDWDAFHINWEKSSGDWLDIALPNMTNSDSNTVFACNVGLFRPHGVGEREIMEFAQLVKMRMFVEILDSEGDNIVGVLGFKPLLW
jgi:hypothetical protein